MQFNRNKLFQQVVLDRVDTNVQKSVTPSFYIQNVILNKVRECKTFLKENIKAFVLQTMVRQ